ncbi:trypsin-like peptidase domain-containing protein [Variovorax sp. MHTC-1]|uniref:trypsin-like peptidase domain-containing protein n=1 Tax=Variovorax sp. MHTC-1 TaxID=2495593 RepID=UPI000F85E293|nr:trypsin-like peptidase domain-containing protein [Variovorax sp. MHTC-1]RST53060.1 PDZ domain-containing protein [Variovorax sp. MHTC-1]
MLRPAAHLFVSGLVLLLGACAASPGQTPAAGVGTEARALHAPAFSSLVASRRASVVDITTLRVGRDEHHPDIELEFAPENDFADRLAWPLPASVRLSQIRDLASGVILASDGLILTSAHVVASIDEAQVRLDDGRRFKARVVGVDRRTDVALLKIEAKDLPVAVIGDSSRLAPGDWVAAISAPFGFHGSVTTGVVSATDRFIGGAGEIPFIQTDVAINPGSSGSPLFNSRGEVVAINSLIYSGSGGYMGLSFSIPINLAMKIAAQLRTHGTVPRAHLGAEVQEMTAALARSFGIPQATGALVVRVDADSPAQAAGLARGDVIAKFDGVRISHFTDVLRHIADCRPGTRSRMDVWRRGKMLTVWVTLSEPPASKIASLTDDAAEWNDGLGLSLGELSHARRLRLRIDGGLLVREAAGLARSEGVRAGDLIIAVNDMRLENVDDFRRSLSRIPAGRTVALLVMRDRRMAYVPVRIPMQGVGSRSRLYSAGPDALLQRIGVAGEEQQ